MANLLPAQAENAETNMPIQQPYILTLGFFSNSSQNLILMCTGYDFHQKLHRLSRSHSKKMLARTMLIFILTDSHFPMNICCFNLKLKETQQKRIEPTATLQFHLKKRPYFLTLSRNILFRRIMVLLIWGVIMALTSGSYRRSKPFFASCNAS